MDGTTVINIGGGRGSALRRFFGVEDHPLGSDPWTLQWIRVFLVLGVVARLGRYLLKFPLWDDECFLAFNIGERSFAELMNPLEYHQVSPILFLWLEKAFVTVLGFNEYALRLPSLMCGIASLFLFRHVAGRLLSGKSLLFAVALFAVSYPCVRYASEAKQYGVEMFFSLLLLFTSLEWLRTPERRGWLWLNAAIVPLAIGFSYPAAFIAGGVSLMVLFEMWGKRTLKPLAPWVVYNVGMLGSFGLVMAFIAKAQGEAELESMSTWWNYTFPPTLLQPVVFLKWFVRTHAGDLFGYPIGGGPWTGTLTFLASVTGVVYFGKRREWSFLILALTPPALNFAAAGMHRYPYGGHQKFSMYLAPFICLWAGAGVVVALKTLSRQNVKRHARGVMGLVLFLFLVGSGTVTRDFLLPYKTKSDQRYRAFAQWFWSHAAQEGEVVCMKSDLHQVFSPDAYHELSWSAMHLCNLRIYSPRHARGLPADLDNISEKHPLRCVLYRDSRYAFDEAGLKNWVEEMKGRYRLVGYEKFPFPRYNQRETRLLLVDQVEVFKFAPKTALSSTSSPLDSSDEPAVRR